MKHSSKKYSKGFTLIELMIAVAVIGILSAIAIPAYSSYVVRGKLTEVGAMLLDARTRQEQFYADNRNYGTAGGACGSTLSSGQHFSIACACAAAVAPSTTCQFYALTAASLAGIGLGAAGDYTYTLNNSGAKSTTKYEGATVALTDWKTK